MEEEEERKNLLSFIRFKIWYKSNDSLWKHNFSIQNHFLTYIISQLQSICFRLAASKPQPFPPSQGFPQNILVAMIIDQEYTATLAGNSAIVMESATNLWKSFCSPQHVVSM